MYPQADVPEAEGRAVARAVSGSYALIAPIVTVVCWESMAGSGWQSVVIWCCYWLTVVAAVQLVTDGTRWLMVAWSVFAGVGVPVLAVVALTAEIFLATLPLLVLLAAGAYLAATLATMVPTKR